MSAEPTPETDPLTITDAAILAIRIFSLYLAYFFVNNVIMLIGGISWLLSSRTPNKQDFSIILLWQQLALICIWAVAAAFFWIAAPRLTRWMLPHQRISGPQRLSISGEYLQTVGFSIIGAILAAWAIPPLVFAVIQWWPNRHRMYWGDSAQLIEQLVALAIGVALFLGAKGLSHYWHQLRGRSAQPHDLSQLESPET